jgi:hypothetical protein
MVTTENKSVMLAYFHELVSDHSVSFLSYCSFCLYSRRKK